MAMTYQSVSHRPSMGGYITQGVGRLSRAPLQHRLVPCHSKKGSSNGGEGNFGDELLDFMYAGKKLRKWYGQEGQVLPKDGGVQDDGDMEDDMQGPRDKIMVLYPEESPMAEQVLLQLILMRAPVCVATKDIAQARAGYGTYVDVVQSTSIDGVLKACRVSQSVVLCGNVSARLVAVLEKAKVPHVVLLSGARSGSKPTGIASFFPGKEYRELTDVSRETVLSESSLKYTIVQVDAAALSNAPGGSVAVGISQDGQASGGIPREDAALCIAMVAMNRKPEGVIGLTSSSSSSSNSMEQSTVGGSLRGREEAMAQLLGIS
uniref:NAD(P)-binding domain-containing protein n=1 Tax=Picochlorum oklahomense TaxID=249345 RepID=A0A7S1GGU1_9CHLO|mmetsp:Transcript_1784/g.3649  ORF Transcript_1784/g.3649 Transcript_1784/m.3649 type:complete len:319 (+) Transcript_1784:2-958(+)